MLLRDILNVCDVIFQYPVHTNLVVQFAYKAWER